MFLNDDNSRPKSILKPDISINNEFIATAVKKKSAYIAATKDDK